MEIIIWYEIIPLSGEEPGSDFARSPGMLTENSAFPVAESSFILFSQETRKHKRREARTAYKALIDVFILLELNSTNIYRLYSIRRKFYATKLVVLSWNLIFCYSVILFCGFAVSQITTSLSLLVP